MEGRVFCFLLIITNKQRKTNLSSLRKSSSDATRRLVTEPTSLEIVILKLVFKIFAPLPNITEYYSVLLLTNEPKFLITYCLSRRMYFANCNLDASRRLNSCFLLNVRRGWNQWVDLRTITSRDKSSKRREKKTEEEKKPRIETIRRLHEIGWQSELLINCFLKVLLKNRCYRGARFSCSALTSLFKRLINSFDKRQNKLPIYST